LAESLSKASIIFSIKFSVALVLVAIAAAVFDVAFCSMSLIGVMISKSDFLDALEDSDADRGVR
jgi:hypothetical protein